MPNLELYRYQVLREDMASGNEPRSLDPNTVQGPASFTLSDPDGNLILFDQHR